MDEVGGGKVWMVHVWIDERGSSEGIIMCVKDRIEYPFIVEGCMLMQYGVRGWCTGTSWIYMKLHVCVCVCVRDCSMSVCCVAMRVCVCL